ncbi:hypothetical protein [Undibacterium umbellatum]|uniref:Uncharacterized protein n=1 Tax=Undibacterium umbellatum TaxID=2762300 RepID=A0ABR6Z385_9BURK|nr:hypothetical protein [Undibacterium umbellatum]MBC3906238.1 hypothetical protein [Undibacterium umbellatum]
MNAADQFEVAMHTPGPWRVGSSGGVVCDTPIKDGIPGSDEVKYYGGHLICESMTFANAKLIAAAPDLLAELGKADLIINVMLNQLTTEQKCVCAAKIQELGIHGQGLARAHERDAVLRKASGEPT